MELVDKRNKEKKILSLMMDIYARKHKNEDLSELKDYAFTRIDKCPFMETKTFCSACKVHCYKEDKRAEIRKVMRYSGPRMLFYHPLLAIKHLYYSKIK